MIKFLLACERGHEFESWFPDSEAFETQARRGLVACPECDGRNIHKALMAPAVLGARHAEEGSSVALLRDAKHRELRAAMVELRKKIEANTDDVGEKFPEVARAMHAGDEPQRAIRGRASLPEAKALIEEGIGVVPLPSLPDEAN